MYGAEASRSLVYLKLYQARLRTGHDWLFVQIFLEKAGSSMAVQEAFHQPVTVGRAYMLKLIHLVDEKFTLEQGPYSLVQQPVRGRSKGGDSDWVKWRSGPLKDMGQPTRSKILTTKVDDLQNRSVGVDRPDRAWGRASGGKIRRVSYPPA
jgi:DNA-directed RNA polymerase subunit beta